MPTLVFYVDSYSSKLSLESSFGVSGVSLSNYKLQVTYNASDESISANGKKWKMSRPASELPTTAKQTWDNFLKGTETPVIYFCSTSFDISKWSSDSVTDSASILFRLQPSTMGTLARFVSILDAQE